MYVIPVVNSQIPAFPLPPALDTWQKDPCGRETNAVRTCSTGLPAPIFPCGRQRCWGQWTFPSHSRRYRNCGTCLCGKTGQTGDSACFFHGLRRGCQRLQRRHRLGPGQRPGDRQCGRRPCDVLKTPHIVAGSPAVEDTRILARFNDVSAIPADMWVIAARAVVRRFRGLLPPAPFPVWATVWVRNE